MTYSSTRLLSLLACSCAFTKRRLSPEISVADGRKRRLEDDDLGLLFRRFAEIVRRVEEGTIEKGDTITALQAIVEGKGSKIGEPCKRNHRAPKMPFKRPKLEDRRRSLAPIRLRSKDRLNRLYFRVRVALQTRTKMPERDKRLLPEDIIVEMWEAENIPDHHINFGAVPIEGILGLEREFSQEEAMIVNHTIQWLGTNSGREFLYRFIRVADLNLS